MNRTLVGYLAGCVATFGYAAWRAHSRPPYVGIPDPTYVAVGGAVGALIANILRR